MQSIQLLYPELNGPSRKVVITTHQKPDGDAMGSSLGLFHFLTQLGHQVQVISPTNWANFLSWMPGVESVLDFETEMDRSTNFINEADWVFCLDFNALVRTKRMESALEQTAATRILIDHHQEPQSHLFTYGVSDTTKSSTAEMVYDFIIGSGLDQLINNEIAQCLYAGVMTDTGSFRFPSTSPDVHTMVAHLLRTGLQQSIIHEKLFDQFSENRLRFIGNTLLNRMQVFYEFNTALIAIPQADLVKYDIKTGDTEGLVNYPLSIEGIKLAAIIIDRGEERRCSFRSKGDFDVNTFARNHFNGGGHYNAAGGLSKEKLEVVVEKFIQTLSIYKDQLSTYTF
jgi:phosphoesterase RecJ-like protein